MPRGRRQQKAAPEVFRFSVDDWSFTYGLHLNEKPDRLLGRCWETHSFELHGALRCGTHRRIERVALTISASDFEPGSWREESRGIGTIMSVGHGTMRAMVLLPTVSFHTLLIAVVAGKVKGAGIVVHEMGRSHGLIRSFHTANLDEED